MKKPLHAFWNSPTVCWFRRNPWTIGFAILAVGVLMAVHLTDQETNDRQKAGLHEARARTAAVCRGQNTIKQEITDYLDDLGKGASTIEAPVPENLPPAVRTFIIDSRAASRTFSQAAAEKAKAKFKVETCSK